MTAGLWLLRAFRALRPFLPYIAAFLVLAGLLSAYGHREYGRGSHSRDAEVSALTGTIANLKAASAKALADNEANVKRINGLQDQITKEKNDAVPQRLADGAGAIDAWIRLHPAPAQAHSSGTSQDHAPGVPNAPGQPDAPAQEAAVSRDDLNACNAAYVTATGLQDWIREQAAIDRNIP